MHGSICDTVQHRSHLDAHKEAHDIDHQVVALHVKLLGTLTVIGEMFGTS